MFKKSQIYSIISILLLYLFIINKVVADSPATPDPTIIPFPNILINEVSFKNTEHDWIELSALENGSIKGMKIFDDGAFLEIEDNILVNSGDFILIYFKSEADLIGKDGELLIIQDSKSGLTGTTEQVVVKKPNDEIVDMICWRNSSPTPSETLEFEEYAASGGWEYGNIESCINSDQILKTDSIARKDLNDSNKPDDWIVSNIPTPGEQNIIQNEPEEEPEPEIELLPEIVLPTTIFNYPEEEAIKIIEEKSKCEIELNEEQDKNICKNDIIINEIYPNPKGKDGNQEWIELKNIGNENCSLEGWQIDDEEDGSKPFTLEFIHQISSEGFLLLPSWQTKINLNNSDDYVRLFSPEGNLVDEINYEDSPEAESFSNFENNFKWSKIRTPLTENLIDIEEIKEEEEKKEIIIPNGDLSENIKINEIFPNPDGADKGNEWIEIINESDESVNLGNWYLDTEENSKTKYIFPNVALEKHTHLLINDDQLGFSLKNNDGKVRLVDFNNDLIDEIKFDKSESGKSYAKIRINESEDFNFEWTEELTPGEENPVLFKFEGEITEINNEKAFVSLKTNNGEDISIKYIDDGTSMYEQVFKKGALISATTTEDNILSEFEIIAEPEILEENNNNNNYYYYYIYYLLTIAALGFGGYLINKKYNLIKFVNA